MREVATGSANPEIDTREGEAQQEQGAAEKPLARATDAPRSHRSRFLQGILPVERNRVTADVLAGITLAALGIPEVMGYAKIGGMPVITGLYTILVPIAVFALL